MSRIPFKRHLIILVTCLLALGVIVPLATFAKGTPPGEQKRTNVHPAIATAGQPTPITADCSGPQTLVTLNKGDVFNANATLTTTDPNEQSEGEFLQILDGSVSPPTVLLTVDDNTGSGSVTFTATVSNDPIQACIINIDTDETGTVTFTVTASQPPPVIVNHTPITSTNNVLLKQIIPLNQQLQIACTIDIAGPYVKLIAAIGNTQSTVEIVNVFFDLKAKPVNDVAQMKVAIALIKLVPGFGCASAIVNLLSLGGISLLEKCLTDAGCLAQVQKDPGVKQRFCIAVVDAISGAIPGSYFLLLFAEQRLC